MRKLGYWNQLATTLGLTRGNKQKQRDQKSRRLRLEPLEERQLLSVSFSDNWTGAPNAAWSSAWTAEGTSLSPVIVNNQGYTNCTAGSADATFYYNGANTTNSLEQVAVDSSANGSIFGLKARRADAASTTFYAMRTDVTGSSGNSNKFYLTKVIGGTETVLATGTLASGYFTSNTYFNLKFYCHTNLTTTTQTDLKAKMWAVGTAEPTGWSLTASDTLLPASHVRNDRRVAWKSTNAPN